MSAVGGAVSWGWLTRFWHGDEYYAIQSLKYPILSTSWYRDRITVSPPTSEGAQADKYLFRENLVAAWSVTSTLDGVTGRNTGPNRYTCTTGAHISETFADAYCPYHDFIPQPKAITINGLNQAVSLSAQQKQQSVEGSNPGMQNFKRSAPGKSSPYFKTLGSNWDAKAGQKVSARISPAAIDFKFDQPQVPGDCRYDIDTEGVVYKQLLVHMRKDVNGQDLFGTLNADQTLISWATEPVTYWHSPPYHDKEEAWRDCNAISAGDNSAYRFFWYYGAVQPVFEYSAKSSPSWLPFDSVSVESFPKRGIPHHGMVEIRTMMLQRW